MWYIIESTSTRHMIMILRWATQALFHTVSAYNNAGFGLLGDNMVRARDHVTTTLNTLNLSGSGYPLRVYYGYGAGYA